MLHILAGAAAAAGGYGAYRFLRKCTICEKRLSWTHNCISCTKSVCGTCGTKVTSEIHRGQEISEAGYICSPQCARKHTELCKSKIDMIEADVSLKARAANVKLYSENYQGKQNIKFNKQISTDYFRTIEEAEDQIKFIAASNDSDFVWEVKKTFITSAEGNYRYKEWMLIGKI